MTTGDMIGKGNKGMYVKVFGLGGGGGDHKEKSEKMGRDRILLVFVWEFVFWFFAYWQ